VDPGAIVEFDFNTPEHTATAYHPGQERQQRVPDGVPAFSSTVNEHHGFWLYRFEDEGVYDLFCAPHEWGGMGMRIVVGDDPGNVVRAPGRPPLPMTAALLGTGLTGISAIQTWNRRTSSTTGQSLGTTWVSISK